MLKSRVLEERLIKVYKTDYYIQLFINDRVLNEMNFIHVETILYFNISISNIPSSHLICLYFNYVYYYLHYFNSFIDSLFYYYLSFIYLYIIILYCYNDKDERI